MSDYSIEHSLVFNTAKRILRFIAPDFRIIARDDILQGQSKLDLNLKTIEVPEGQAFEAAGMVIFYAGVLRLRVEDKYPSVFGKIPNLFDHIRIIEIVAREHADADEAAYRWASSVMANYFPEIDENKASDLVDQRLSYKEWVEYFAAP